MAESKCPKCESNKFELKPNKPQGNDFNITLVQCADCGSVIGVFEDKPLSSIIFEAEKRISIRLNTIEEAINRLILK